MSKSQQFNETLNKAISFLLDYKPDYVQPISNITNLCKLLNLDFFQDSLQDETEDNDSKTSQEQQQRLSIAGKILVLDIDYIVKENSNYNEILNVMLVLASNFDQFNYKNELGENIFLNNLTKESKLFKFNHNLKILKAMDDFSDTDNLNSDDFFQYYQKTMNGMKSFFIDHLNISKDVIFVNKNDEFNVTFNLNGEDIFQIVPVIITNKKNDEENETIKISKLIYNELEKTWQDSTEPLEINKNISFELKLLSEISFNERMSSLFGSENFQNNKSLNFFELKKSGRPIYLTADFLNNKFKYFWKWVFWYKTILEGSTNLTNDGDSIMKNGQLLKFENEIGTWSF
ncbi:hypothetical protein HANVADRAFT_75495 [Hanseniaspora valbyensis NRRL Y-1626]|uniref:Mediator of RNA polymerase II transcription subunit 1 n=1 Tax=Hanseniaspora valbyensis NRRL Y-1626 TaxID=766949 RepID=A0A1B7TD69_9ASCO|nr:hypothetical protein HANVADRAFT_75495 [Hanseniaspora valbyensis NRRL Y-1626]